MECAREYVVLSLLFCIIFVAPDLVICSEAFQDGFALNHVSALNCGSALPSIDQVIASSLVVPRGNDMRQVLFATGVQIYAYNGSSWVLHNVSADLYDFNGLKVGFHFYLDEQDSNGGQATWKTFDVPASRVTGKRVAGVSQKDSIDWLLLETTSQNGTNLFGVANFIQRLYTQHGLSPAADFPAKEGDVFLSNYTSLYTFSAPPQ